MKKASWISKIQKKFWKIFKIILQDFFTELHKVRKISLNPFTIYLNGYGCKTWHIWVFTNYQSQNVFKFLEEANIFICVHSFQLFGYNFSKKSATSQTHFGFTNLGSNMHCFRAKNYLQPKLEGFTKSWTFNFGQNCIFW